MPDFDSIIFDRARIYTVDFGRAKEGPSDRHFPDVDSAGYHDEAHPDEHGPITSSVVGLNFANVKFYRTQISLKAKLFAVSADPAILQIVEPANGQLTGGRSEIIQFAPVSAGRTAIEIRYNWADGPVLGRLYVEVYEPRTVRVAVHLVKIDHTDSDGKATLLNQPDRFLGADCPDIPSKLTRAKVIVSHTNETWLPHGIEVVVTGATERVWSAKELGHYPIDLHDMSFRLLVGGALAGDRVAGEVNVYFVPFDLVDDIAFTLSGIDATTLHVTDPRDQGRPDPRKLNIAGICFSSLYDPVSTIIVKDPDAAISNAMAHELGHFMTLQHSPNDQPVVQVPKWMKWFDADAGEAPKAFRDDSETRRRLLYPTNRYPEIQRKPWRSDTGYGERLQGSFVTYRKLPANQDVSFGESSRARDAIHDRYFYG